MEGEVILQNTTEFGQLFEVDWTVTDTKIELRTIWEITAENSNPRLVCAFIKD